MSKLSSYNEFLKGYLTAAFWTNDDDAPGGCDYAQTDRPDAMFSKLSDEAMLKAVRDCRRFERENEALLVEVNDDAQSGADLWLTRNGHGAGFWARDLGEIGDKLTAACKAFAEVDLYTGDDGKLYFS